MNIFRRLWLAWQIVRGRTDGHWGKPKKCSQYEEYHFTGGWELRILPGINTFWHPPSDIGRLPPCNNPPGDKHPE